MIRELLMNVLMAIWIFGCFIPNKFVISLELSCDPVNFSANPEFVLSALENPGPCSCTNPCTVDRAAEFVRLYYIKRGMKRYHRLDVTNPLESPLFNYRHSLKVIIHGFAERGTSEWMPPTGKQLAEVFCGYVILVDYGAISNCSYDRAVAEIVPSVAKYVSNVIQIFNFKPQNIEIIGFSLGAHIAGFIGASLNNTVRRITGLDPAGPGYDETNTGLNKTCAQFVQVLHSDAGDLGTVVQRGDADFYANNRSELQPGCTFKLCSHTKSFFYYFASLFSQIKFIGTSCGQRNCMKPMETSRFGEFNDGKSGQFCFETAPCFPYATSIIHCEKKHSSKKTRHNCNDCKSKSSKHCKHH